MICTPHQILFEWLYQHELDGQGIWHVLGTGKVHTGFWWGGLREGDHLEDLGIR